jgi:two-component system, cell cycle sensor histidine kinase and response regulator CckA
MGDRVTRSKRSRELVRARSLQQALERGASPSFIPPDVASPAAPPSSLSWNLLGSPAEVPTSEAAISETIISDALSSQRIPSPAALDIRRQYLEQLFQGSPDSLIVVDPSFRTQCVNREFQRVFGYSSSEILGQPIDSLIFPPDRAAEAQWIAQCLQRGEQLSLETQRRCKDGTLVDVSAFSAPLIIDGRVVAFYATYRDISERKRAEALNSALYRIAEKASASQDLQQFFAAIHGIVDELMCARNFSIAIHDPESQVLSFPYFVDEQESAPAPGKLARGLVEYVLRTGEPLLCTPELAQQLQQRGEVELSTPSALQWLGVPLKVNHHVLGALVLKSYSKNTRLSGRDKEVLTLISRQLAAAIDHKRNEQALRRSEVRYRSLVQTAVYGIYRSSLEGQFLDVNPALIGMLGYNSALEVLALDPQKDVFVDPAEYTRLVDEFRRTGRMDGFEVRWKRKDGAAITVRISGRAVATENEPADVLEAIAEDITERRVLEDQFRQAQKMEAVGRLAGGIAHDFNNLLMVISGYTEVLLDQPHARRPAPLQSRSHSAGFRSRHHAHPPAPRLQPQTTSRTQSHRRQRHRQTWSVSCARSSAKCRTRHPSRPRRRLHPRRCRPARTGHHESRGQRQGRHAQRRQNLHPHRQRHPRRLLPPRKYFHQNGPYIMISVSDTGLGMDRETQARIFEPFFTTKEKGKGTGLGLSTVYGIIKQSGGYVFVQSELGRGTVFTIYFPRVDEPSEAHGATPVSLAAVGGSETILLVEDEESVRQLVRETLEARGYRVLEAENGNAGLALAASHPGILHLVITDVVMPGLSGHELVQQLVHARPGIKVLYLSGYAQDAVESNASAEAPKAFLQKPFTLQSLSRKVREVLGPPTN